MSLALNEALIRYGSSNTLSIRKAVTRIGQQHEQELWVVGQRIQVDAHGEVIPPECQLHIMARLECTARS